MPRRARRTGNVFWGCSNYPRCDFTTNHEPLGGCHDADDGPLARKGDEAICLKCGSLSEAAPDAIVPGERYPGGPPNPEALARPARGRGGPRSGAAKTSSKSSTKAGAKTTAKGRAKPRAAARGTAAAGETDEQRFTRVKRTRPTEPAPDA